jgi:hypothetical protein
MVRLNKDWAITSDRYSVTICKIGKSKAGKETFTHKWYYQNYEQALEGLIDRDLQDLDTLKDIAKRIKKLKTDIRKMLEKHDIAGRKK